MRIPPVIWTRVQIAERQVDAAGRRAQAALAVELTEDDGNDSLFVSMMFEQQARDAIGPLVVVYDWARGGGSGAPKPPERGRKGRRSGPTGDPNSDNRVDIADVERLHRYIQGLREVVGIWIEQITLDKIS